MNREHTLRSLADTLGILLLVAAAFLALLLAAAAGEFLRS